MFYYEGKEKCAQERQGTDGSELLQTEEQDRGTKGLLMLGNRMNRRGLRRDLGTGLGTGGSWAEEQDGEKVKSGARQIYSLRVLTYIPMYLIVRVHSS